MQISILPLSLLLSVAAAQSSSSIQAAPRTSACAALPVLEACLASTQAIVLGCQSTDYSCLCQKWTDVLTCFDQCPNDARQASTLSSKTTFCANAETYASTTVKPISRPVSSAATTTGTGGSSEATATGDSDGVRVADSTSSSPSASSTANAANKKELTGGLLMGVAGLVGAFL